MRRAIRQGLSVCSLEELCVGSGQCRNQLGFLRMGSGGPVLSDCMDAESR